MNTLEENLSGDRASRKEKRTSMYERELRMLAESDAGSTRNVHANRNEARPTSQLRDDGTRKLN